MRVNLSHLLLVFALLPLCTPAFCQQDSSVFNRILSFPDKVFGSIDKQSQKFEHRLISQTEKYLNKLEKQELKLKRKLRKTDSLKAEETFGNVQERYKNLRSGITNKTEKAAEASNHYLGHMDSLSTAMKFLSESSVIKNSEAVTGKLKGHITSITSLNNSFERADYVRKKIREQQERVKQQLQNTPLSKELKKYKQQVYYYQQQVKEYREALDDPKLLGSKVLTLAKKIPAFQSFFNQYSQFASLFPAPDNNAIANGIVPYGLQTRVQVGQMIQQQFAGSNISPQQYIQQGMGQAQSQINQLKNKLQELGGGNSDDMVPDFKPNDQKTKSFKQRLELSTNFQTTRSRTYFPVTTDLGLSLGYKLNSKSIVGIGSSYKLGWGSSFNNIQFSHQGLGFRSFLDWKLKGSFWVSGGYEQNYLSTFRSINELNNRAVWKQSALLGISKVIDIKSKFFKKTRAQLLYDFLWKQQLPQTQAVLFRAGYNF
jgi:hypothetical protein